MIALGPNYDACPAPLAEMSDVGIASPLKIGDTIAEGELFIIEIGDTQQLSVILSCSACNAGHVIGLEGLMGRYTVECGCGESFDIFFDGKKLQVRDCE